MITRNKFILQKFQRNWKKFTTLTIGVYVVKTFL